MAITSLDQIIAGMQPPTSFFKPSATTSAGIWHSLWYIAGFPAAGSGPASTASALLDSTTTGAMPFTNPSGGRLSYPGVLDLAGSQVGTLLVYDRQAHYGLTATGAATITMVSPVSVSGQRSGAGEIWIEHTVTGSAGTKAVTASYTNQSGTTGRTTISVTVPASPPQYSMFRLPFQSGDTGALSIASVTLGAALQGSGTANAVIMRQIARLQCTAAGIGATKDAISNGLARLYDSSCLAFMWLPGASTSGDIHGSISVAQG
jgi:hypothetical protein